MSEEKKSIENLQEQETNTENVKGGFNPLQTKQQNRMSDGDHVISTNRDEDVSIDSNLRPTSKDVEIDKLGAARTRK